MKSQTAANLLQDGWHCTSYRMRGYEVWTKNDKYLLFDRKNQQVKEVGKIKSAKLQ